MQPARAGVYYGGIEVPLSPAGREEARRVGAALRGLSLACILSSPLQRARFGAECIAAAHPGLVPEIEPDLAEIARGRWVGLTADEVRRAFPGDLEAHAADLQGWRGHGGESLGDLRRRVLAARDRLLARAGSGDGAGLVLVSHLHPTRALLADALGLGLERWEELDVPTGSLAVLEYREGRGQVLQMPDLP